MKNFKQKFIGLFSLLASLNIYAQCDIPEPFSGNTGSNMTVILLPSFIQSLTISDTNTYLVALNQANMVLGSCELYGVDQTSMAVWGDDTFTTDIDGAIENELISFQLVDEGYLYQVTPNTGLSYYETNNVLILNNSESTLICDPVEPIIEGCTNQLAVNFNSDANTEDGSCIIYGCTDPEALNYNDMATDDNGSCGYYYLGEACEYIPPAYSMNTGSNMSVMFISEFMSSLSFSDPSAYLVAISEDGLVIGSTSINGLNQTSMAVWGDDTFTLEIDGAIENELISFQLVDGSSLYEVIMPNSVNYTTNLISIQDSPAISVNLICSNSLEIIAVEGCTNETADNYNEFANVDDGSCVIWGCVLEWADNYNELATHHDGNCTLLLNEDDYHIMDSIMNSSVNAPYTIDSLTQLNQDLMQTNFNLDSMNSSLSAEISSMENDLEQYNVVLHGFSILQDAYEQCQPDLFGQIVLELEEGWNMIGYNLIFPSASQEKFELIEDDIWIVKDNDGLIYWPEYNYNNLGDLLPGHGYQINMLNPVTFSFGD